MSDQEAVQIPDFDCMSLAAQVVAAISEGVSNAALRPADLEKLVVWHLLPGALVAHLKEGFALAAGDRKAARAYLDRVPDDLQNSLEYLICLASLPDTPPEEKSDIFAEARDLYANLFAGCREMIERGHARLALDIFSRIMPLLGPLLFSQARHAKVASKSLGLLGCALDDLSMYDEALIAYDAALDLISGDSPDERLSRANLLSNIGSLHQNDGHYERSGVALEASIAVFRTLLPDQMAAHGLAAALINLGHSDNFRGRQDRCRRQWREAIEVCETHGLNSDGLVVDAYIHLISRQFDAEEWEDAIFGMRKAWRIAIAGKHISRRAELIAIVGQACLRGEQIDRAVRIFSNAVSRYRQLAPDYVNDRLDALRCLARATGYAGRFDGAKAIAEAALADGVAAVGNLHEQNMRTKGVLADLCWETADYETGLAWARSTASDCDRLYPRDHFWRQKYEGVVADFLMATGEWRAAFDLLLENIEIEVELTRRLIDEHTDLLELSAMRTASSHMDLAVMAALRMKPLGKRRGRRLMEALLRFSGSGAAILGARRGNFRGLPASYLTYLQKDGPEVTLIAGTWLFDLGGAVRRALYLCSRQSCTITDIGPAAGLNDALAQWASTCRPSSDPMINDLLTAIRAAGTDCSRLIWLPDRDLALYPLQIVEGQAQAPLIKDMAVLQSRDIHSVVATHPPGKNAGALLVGLSEFEWHLGGPFDPLPEVLTEIAQVAELYRPHMTLTNEAATLDAVLAELARMPIVVHLATHGLTSAAGRGASELRRALRRVSGEDNLSACGIVLSGATFAKSLLTARRIAGLDLSGVKLVVLAACDSGVGVVDGAEGILGFQSALHGAGVATVVTSFWPINDTLAPELMTEFHKGWLENLRPSEALRRAQLKMIEHHQMPTGWGGLTVSGCDLSLRDRL